MSVRQQHVAFFDQDNNGIIYPWETYRVFGNFLLTFVTQPGWMPNPLLPVYMDRIHRGKHGSDSETLDTEGRFMPVNLENMFTKYGRAQTDKLTYEELWEMNEANLAAYVLPGWIVSKAEWLLLYKLAKDQDGFLSEEAAKGCYDGSLFEYRAKMNKAGNKKRR